MLSAYVSGQLGASFFDYFKCASERELHEWAVDHAICESVRIYLHKHANVLTQETSGVPVQPLRSESTGNIERQKSDGLAENDEADTGLNPIEMVPVLLPITKIATAAEEKVDRNAWLSKILYDLCESGNLDLLSSYQMPDLLETIFWALGRQQPEIVRDMNDLRADLMKNRLKVPHVNDKNITSLLILAHLGCVAVEGKNSCMFQGTKANSCARRRVTLPDCSVSGAILNSIGFKSSTAKGKRILGVPNSPISYECTHAVGGMMHTKPSNVRIQGGDKIEPGLIFGCSTS